MIFKKEKILVCDDQPMLRNLLSSAIRDFGAKYEVVEAPNGAVAEQLLRRMEFWAVFMDVEMPEQDGFTTLEKIRAENLVGDSPVIMCTGCDEEEHLLRGWQLKADYYLTKPFDLDEIDALLRELEQNQAREEEATVPASAATDDFSIPVPHTEDEGAAELREGSEFAIPDPPQADRFVVPGLALTE